jgi:hypothetical protein
LPGIVYIVLTMGMAVDADALIYQRIRKEVRQGQPAGRAIDFGFDTALSASTVLLPDASWRKRTLRSLTRHSCREAGCLQQCRELL